MRKKIRLFDNIEAAKAANVNKNETVLIRMPVLKKAQLRTNKKYQFDINDYAYLLAEYFYSLFDSKGWTTEDNKIYLIREAALTLHCKYETNDLLEVVKRKDGLLEVNIIPPKKDIMFDANVIWSLDGKQYRFINYFDDRFCLCWIQRKYGKKILVHSSQLKTKKRR